MQNQIHPGLEAGGAGCETVSRELDALFGSAQFGARRLGEARGMLSEAAQAHLVRCAACRKLVAWFLGEESGRDAAKDPARGIARMLSADLKPVKPLPSVTASVLQFLGVFAILMAGLVMLWTARGLLAPPAWQVSAMLAVCVAGALLLAMSLARQMRPGTAAILPEGPALTILAIALLGGFAALFPWSEFGSTSSAPGAFFDEGWSCFWPGISMAAPVAGLLWIVARRGVTYSLASFGAALGALAGLFGLTALELSCTNHDAAHVLVSHVGVLAASAVAGAVAGRVAGHWSSGQRRTA